MTNYKITPAEFLTEIGWRFVRRGNWLALNICPFCEGGAARDTHTFAVHSSDGNFFCHRAKCGMRGTFWALIESQGKDIKEYLGMREQSFKQNRRGYIYGRESSSDGAKIGAKKPYIYGRAK